jgi:anti-sigma factor RsiW
MNCNIPDNDLYLFADGSLSDERRLKVESHLTECKECREYLSFIEKSIMVIEKDKEISQNPFLFTRIMAKLEASNKSHWSHAKKTVPSFVFSLFLAGVIIGGINLGRLYSTNTSYYNNDLQEEISYLDDIKQESIETFFITKNDEEND